MAEDNKPVDAALIIDQAPDAMIFAGNDGVIQVWNPAAERIFGFPSSAAIGGDLNIIIPESLQERHWTGYDRALAAGDTKYRGQLLPTKARKQDGTEIYVELSFSIVHGTDGGVIGALAIARDITERFEREKAARRLARGTEAPRAETSQSPD